MYWHCTYVLSTAPNVLVRYCTHVLAKCYHRHQYMGPLWNRTQYMGAHIIKCTYVLCTWVHTFTPLLPCAQHMGAATVHRSILAKISLILFWAHCAVRGQTIFYQSGGSNSYFIILLHGINYKVSTWLTVSQEGGTIFFVSFKEDFFGCNQVIT